MIHSPYALALSDCSAPDSSSEVIHTSVIGSFDIFTACNEAADIASRSGKPVAFDFNEQTVVVRPGEDPEAIARAWWQEQYGETPEQTWANR